MPAWPSAEIVFPISPVITSAGRCSIADTRRPVPTLLGHEVKYPTFWSKQYWTSVSIMLSMSSAVGRADGDRPAADAIGERGARDVLFSHHLELVPAELLREAHLPVPVLCDTARHGLEHHAPRPLQVLFARRDRERQALKVSGDAGAAGQHQGISGPLLSQPVRPGAGRLTLCHVPPPTRACPLLLLSGL